MSHSMSRHFGMRFREHPPRQNLTSTPKPLFGLGPEAMESPRDGPLHLQTLQAKAPWTSYTMGPWHCYFISQGA